MDGRLSGATPDRPSDSPRGSRDSGIEGVSPGRDLPRRGTDEQRSNQHRSTVLSTDAERARTEYPLARGAHVASSPESV